MCVHCSHIKIQLLVANYHTNTHRPSRADTHVLILIYHHAYTPSHITLTLHYTHVPSSHPHTLPHTHPHTLPHTRTHTLTHSCPHTHPYTHTPHTYIHPHTLTLYLIYLPYMEGMELRSFHIRKALSSELYNRVASVPQPCTFLTVSCILYTYSHAFLFNRHNNSKPEDIELSPMPNVDNRPPAPLPRPSATLEVATPHDVHVTRVHTSPHHSEALQGTLPQEIPPSQLYENVTLMPLSEAGEIADQQLCANPNYAASEDTGSGAYIREVETVPPSRLLPRTSDTLPRDELTTSDFYMKPLASSISPPLTHHSPHSTPHNTPPTSLLFTGHFKAHCLSKSSVASTATVETLCSGTEIRN